MVSYLHAHAKDHRPLQPRIIVLYTTSRCNARCSFCLTAPQRKTAPAPDMGLDVVQALLDAFPRTKIYKVSGAGEPLVNPQLPEILELLKKHKKRVLLQTNGIALDSNTPLYLVDKINISVNASNPEEYLARCGVDKFSQVKKACRIAQSHTTLDVTFVLDQTNYHRLLKYVDLAVLLGARRVGLPSATPMERTPSTVWWGDAVRQDLNALLDMAEKEHGQRINITRTRRPPRLRRGYGPCKMSREMLFVDGAGLVAPCCRGDGPRAEFGSVLEEGEGIFSTSSIRRFRQIVSAEGAPPKCRSCNEPVG